MEQPGKCPICGMELIPQVNSSTASIDPSAIHLSKEAAQLANVLTSVVTKHKPVKEVRLFGKVQADERLFQSQTAHIPGRIERLSVNFTGESIVKGQVLAEIYSPELITAQQELLETVKTKQLQPELYEASKEKLRQWKLTDDQIDKIESSGVVQNNFEVVSNTSGTVTARRVNTGDHVSQGTILFDIADLSKVWIMFDAYESDLQFLHIGEKLSFTLQALPGTDFSGNIIFIDPVIDPVTRVAKVRVETGNQSGKLKPEMFATGIVSATLWTGKRSVVYVKQPGTDEPIFKLREIGLGPMLGESYVITDGLTEGEEIVTSGTFSVDAAAQLEGKPSMMNRIQTSGNAIIHTSFTVSGNCDMCKERIEKAALSVNGVANATWNADTKMIFLDYDSNKTDKVTIQKEIAKVGHDTELFKADDVTYKSLPECCHYRK
jgi:Cu(I)/Ag(I) efflux system membrane fusion protein